jgi:hypothetical protein
MVSFEEIQTAYYMVAATGVLIAAVFYILNLRISQRNQELSLKTQELALKAQQQASETRQAQLFIQLYTTFTSYDFKSKWNDVMQKWEWKDIDDYNSKYGFHNHEEFSKLDFIGTYFEGIGVMVKRGLIDVTLVDDLMSGHIVSGWERFEPIIMDWRENLNWPQMLEWWEYLYHEVKGIMEKQHPELVSKKVATYSENRMESD